MVRGWFPSPRRFVFLTLDSIRRFADRHLFRRAAYSIGDYIATMLGFNRPRHSEFPLALILMYFGSVIWA